MAAVFDSVNIFFSITGCEVSFEISCWIKDSSLLRGKRRARDNLFALRGAKRQAEMRTPASWHRAHSQTCDFIRCSGFVRPRDLSRTKDFAFVYTYIFFMCFFLLNSISTVGPRSTLSVCMQKVRLRLLCCYWQRFIVDRSTFATWLAKKRYRSSEPPRRRYSRVFLFDTSSQETVATRR